MRARFWPCGLLFAAALAGCGSPEPAPSRSTTGRTEQPASGERATATGRTAGRGGSGGGTAERSGSGSGSLSGAFVDQVVTEFCGKVSQRHAKGWPAYVIRGADGLPSAAVRVQDRRGAGGQDAELLRARLTQALTEQGVLGIEEPGDPEPDEPADPIEPGDVDPRREPMTAFAVQVDLHGDGAATVVEVRLVDLGGEQAALVQVRLRHTPG